MDQVDIWNIIECFRENGLNTLEADTELNASRVEAIITSIFSQLNKRIPVSRQVDVQMSVSMLLNWLLSAYDRYTQDLQNTEFTQCTRDEHAIFVHRTPSVVQTSWTFGQH